MLAKDIVASSHAYFKDIYMAAVSHRQNYWLSCVYTAFIWVNEPTAKYFADSAGWLADCLETSSRAVSIYQLPMNE